MSKVGKLNIFKKEAIISLKIMHIKIGPWLARVVNITLCRNLIRAKYYLWTMTNFGLFVYIKPFNVRCGCTINIDIMLKI